MRSERELCTQLLFGGVTTVAHGSSGQYRDYDGQEKSRPPREWPYTLPPTTSDLVSDTRVYVYREGAHGPDTC
jgi:hypothetical protein|eukprot:COSAG01_NODE_303_length_19167_cov_10.792454_25_plen_73_part_00